MISQSTIVRDHSISSGTKGADQSAVQPTSVINMAPKFPHYNLTEEDRLTHAKWMRAMAAFYGCVALLVLGVIVLTKASSLLPDEASDRQAWPSGSQAERGNPGADLSRKAR